MTFDLKRAIKETIAKMTDEERDYYNAVQAALLSCYVDKSMRAVVIVGTDTGERHEAIELSHMMTINANDIDLVKLFACGSIQVGTLVMADAPAPERLN